MDEDDYKYAEIIIDFLKKRGRDVRLENLTNYIHSMVQYDNLKKINNYDHIFKYLESLDLIRIVPLTPRTSRLEVTDLLRKTDSIEKLLAEKKQEEEQEKEDKRIERELKKRQLWQVKYWWVPALFTLILGAIIQKIFDLL